MFDQIKLSTQYDKLSLKELRNKNSNNDNDEAKMELVLRSVNGIYRSVSKNEAIDICDAELKKNPDHVFYNFARALHEEDQTKKKQFLVKAIFSKTDSDNPALNQQAAFTLAKIELKNKNYIEAQAWLVKSILLGSEEASLAFTGGTSSRFTSADLGSFSHMSDILDLSHMNEAVRTKYSGTLHSGNGKYGNYALGQCTLLATVLSKRKLNKFGESGWCLSWSENDSEMLRSANYQDKKNPIKYLFNTSHTIHQLAKWAMWNGPFIFHEFFTYCFNNQIISEAIFQNVMEFFLQYSPVQSLKDKANYSLACFYWNKIDFNDIEGFNHLNNQVLKYLYQISEKFFDYKLTDLSQVADPYGDFIKYAIFKKLFAHGHKDNALVFLSNVKHSQFLDEDIFAYFKAVDPNENNSGILELKRDLFNKILREKTSHPFLIQKVKQLSDNDDKNFLFTEIRSKFKSFIIELETYDEIRSKRKENRSLGYLFGETARQTFLKELEKLKEHEIINCNRAFSKEEYYTLWNQLSDFISNWKKKLEGKKIGEAFAGTDEILKDLKEQIDSMPNEEELQMIQVIREQEQENTISQDENVYPKQQAEMNLPPPLVFDPNTNQYYPIDPPPLVFYPNTNQYYPIDPPIFPANQNNDFSLPPPYSSLKNNGGTTIFSRQTGNIGNHQNLPPPNIYHGNGMFEQSNNNWQQQNNSSRNQQIPQFPPSMNLRRSQE